MAKRKEQREAQAAQMQDALSVVEDCVCAAQDDIAGLVNRLDTEVGISVADTRKSQGRIKSKLTNCVNRVIRSGRADEDMIKGRLDATINSLFSESNVSLSLMATRNGLDLDSRGEILFPESNEHVTGDEFIFKPSGTPEAPNGPSKTEPELSAPGTLPVMACTIQPNGWLLTPLGPFVPAGSEDAGKSLSGPIARLPIGAPMVQPEGGPGVFPSEVPLPVGPDEQAGPAPGFPTFYPVSGMGSYAALLFPENRALMARAQAHDDVPYVAMMEQSLEQTETIAAAGGTGRGDLVAGLFLEGDARA